MDNTSKKKLDRRKKEKKAYRNPKHNRSRQRLFVKGDHKRQFAYEDHTARDKHDFVLETVITPGNVHDSVTFVMVHVFPESGKNDAVWEPDDQRLILTMASNENGIPDFAVGSDFSGLDASVQECFYPVDDAHPALGLEEFYEQTYTDGDAGLHLSALWRNLFDTDQ